MKTLFTSLVALFLFLFSMGCDEGNTINSILDTVDTNTVDTNTVELDTINFLNEATWVFDFFDQDWESMGYFKYCTFIDTLSLTLQFPADCSYFGLDGINNINRLGSFDTIQVIYKSNHNLKIVCATSDDKDGWESNIVLTQSDVFAEFKIQKDQFTKTWTSGQEISACDIIAFTNEDVDNLIEGESLNIEIASILVY